MSTSYPRHGILNNIQKPLIANRINLQKTTASNVLKTISDKTFIPDALSNVGPMKGIVLRVEPQVGEAQPGTWASQFFGSFFSKGSKPLLVQIKVRIPEIHSMLPIPDSIGSDSPQHSIIDMYPTFIAQDDSVPEPSVGSLVFVDFGNKNDFTDPIYICPVNKNAATANSIAKNSALNSHNNACAGTFGSKTPLGDVMAAKNAPASLTGPPLLQRKTSSNLSQEHNIIRGNRASTLTYSKWQKAVTAAGVPGTTWIGGLLANGAEHAEHSSAKRDTIIFAPNTIDYNAPIELMYWFHGFREFANNQDFEGRLAPNTKKLSQDGRNFILVIPELPWSIQCNDSKSNRDNNASWQDRDNFSNFHSEVLTKIKEVLSEKANINYISITAHGDGGGALRNAADNSGLTGVKPNKITFSEASYQDFLDVVWGQYVNNSPDVELNILVVSGGTAYKKALKFKDITSERKNVALVEIKNKDQSQIGDEALLYVNTTLLDEEKRIMDTEVSNMESNPPTDFDKEEGPAAFDTVKKSYNNVLNVVSGPSAPPAIGGDVSPSAREKTSVNGIKNTSATIKEAVPFQEARVRVENFGSLQGNETVLTTIPSVAGKQERLHVLAAKRFTALNQAWLTENPGAPPILIVSGWRKHIFDSQGDYQAWLNANYPNGDGTKWVAYNSPHETGLAMDIGNNGLCPNRKTNPIQAQQPLYRWLVANAHRFGFTPYKQECWHWECALPRDSWTSGEEFSDNFALRIEHPGGGNDMPRGGTGLGTNCVGTIGNLIGGASDLLSGLISGGGTLDKNKKNELITQLANQLGIEPAVALAFFTIESGNRNGFCKDTGKPIIRFEPHVFGDPRRLTQFGIDTSQVLWFANSAAEMKKKWGEMGFRHGGCGSQQYEYDALAYAAKINEEHAYGSISIGIAQIMGNNHDMVGFKTAKQMFDAYAKSEEEQIRGFFKFAAKRSGLLDALRNKDFLTAAKKYNGDSSQAPLYASKIEKQYNIYSGQNNNSTAVA